MKKNNEKDGGRMSASAATGVIALVFLAIGWQTALFVHKAATARVLSNMDSPDTVYIYEAKPPSSGDGDNVTGTDESKYVRKSPDRPAQVRSVRQRYAPRTYESFPFDPNTASVEDLMRLGFSAKQAESIDNYRRSGGHFARASDFAKSYVVADSVFNRLEPYIEIPKVDLNAADSAALDALPGIGPYYAARIVSYREELGGYSYPEQLMDIYRFDAEKFDGLSDLVFTGPADAFRLWTLPEDSLSLHPYIDKYAAHGIVVFRDNNPKASLSVEALVRAGVIDASNGEKLSRCRIAAPDQ